MSASPVLVQGKLNALGKETREQAQNQWQAESTGDFTHQIESMITEVYSPPMQYMYALQNYPSIAKLHDTSNWSVAYILMDCGLMLLI